MSYLTVTTLTTGGYVQMIHHHYSMWFISILRCMAVCLKFQPHTFPCWLENSNPSRIFHHFLPLCNISVVFCEASMSRVYLHAPDQIKLNKVNHYSTLLRLVFHDKKLYKRVMGLPLRTVMRH